MSITHLDAGDGFELQWHRSGLAVRWLLAVPLPRARLTGAILGRDRKQCARVEFIELRDRSQRLRCGICFFCIHANRTYFSVFELCQGFQSSATGTTPLSFAYCS